MRRVRDYEGMLLTEVPWRDRLPYWRAFLRWYVWRFNRATALPGDVRSDPARDLYWIVWGGRPGSLRGYRVSGQLVAATGLAKYFRMNRGGEEFVAAARQAGVTLTLERLPSWV